MGGHAAVNGHRSQLGETRQRAHLLMNLRRQLARRRQHEHPRATAAFPGKSVQQGERESGRLAGAGLRQAKHVTTREGSGNRL